MEQYFDDQLFISKDYKITSFQYKDIQQDLLSLDSGSTDFDLTGQVIWSAARMMSRYIIDQKEIFQDKIVFELGAGVGLVGYVTSQFAKLVYLTDYQDVVIDILNQNLQFAKNNVKVFNLLWGKQQTIEILKDIEHVDFILGADIIFWPNVVETLIETLLEFFNKFKNLRILIASHRRSLQVEQQVLQICELHGITQKLIMQEDDDILMEFYLK